MVLNSLLVFKQNSTKVQYKTVQYKKVQENSEYVEQMANVSHCKKSWLVYMDGL